jgi:hypothetical protein
MHLFSGEAKPKPKKVHPMCKTLSLAFSGFYTSDELLTDYVWPKDTSDEKILVNCHQI